MPFNITAGSILRFSSRWRQDPVLYKEKQRLYNILIECQRGSEYREHPDHTPYNCTHLIPDAVCMYASLSPEYRFFHRPQAEKAKIDAISLRYTAVRKKTVKTFHKAGIEVCVWTVPDKKKARKYKRMGVDYITCNSALFE